MINREAFERARRETDFVAELALSLKELADDLEGCADREDLECVMKTRRALDSKREKVWDIAQRYAPPELRDRWRETIELRVREFDDMASKIQNLAGAGNWEAAYGWCLDLDETVIDRAMRDMDEALVQRYLEIAGTPPPRGSATLGQAHAPSNETGILRCRFCGSPYAYRENLELHERSCPKRG